MVITKKVYNNKRCKGVEREHKLVQSLWKLVWKFAKKLKIELPHDSPIPLLGIHPLNTLQKDTTGNSDQTILCCGGSPVFCRVFSSISLPSPTRCQKDIPPSTTVMTDNKNLSRHCQVSPGVKAQITPFENYWFKRYHQ